MLLQPLLLYLQTLLAVMLMNFDSMSLLTVVSVLQPCWLYWPEAACNILEIQLQSTHTRLVVCHEPASPACSILVRQPEDETHNVSCHRRLQKIQRLGTSWSLSHYHNLQSA